MDESKLIVEQLQATSAASQEAQLDEDALNDELREQLGRQGQEQMATQRHLYSVLMEQMKLLLSYLGSRDNNEEEICEILAHKVSCMAALAKCSSTKMLQERLTYLEPAAVCVVSVCNQIPQSATVRAKTVMFLHRMVHALGPHVVELLRHTYATMLSNSDSGDAEHVVQVLNQVMAEFKENALPLVDEALSPTLEKFQVSSPLSRGYNKRASG